MNKRQTHSQEDKQTGWQSGGYAGRNIDVQTDRLVDRQEDRHIRR